ncbi:MAG TPA: hypothetical protein VMN04_13775 [Thermoanaerobaculia bacterium]|nr:hypothetical protein [Thermoanaerobaculia bacterium]
MKSTGCNRAATALLLGLLAFLAPKASAQAFEVGGHATYTKADGADGTWAGGAQARFRFLGFLGAEGLVDYKRTTYSSGGVDTLRVEQYPVQASLMIWLTPRTWPVQIYGLGGGGWYYTRSTYLGPEGALGSTTSNEFGGHAGGGAEIVAGPVGFYGDARWVWMNIGSLDAIKDRYDTNQSADFLMVTTGLNFRF